MTLPIKEMIDIIEDQGYKIFTKIYEHSNTVQMKIKNLNGEIIETIYCTVTERYDKIEQLYEKYTFKNNEFVSMIRKNREIILRILNDVNY